MRTAHAVAMLCVFTCTAHRLYSLHVELLQGGGRLFILDGLSMLSAVTLLTVLHPGLVLHSRWKAPKSLSSKRKILEPFPCSQADRKRTANES
jgi:hypothetical protein